MFKVVLEEAEPPAATEARETDMWPLAAWRILLSNLAVSSFSNCFTVEVLGTPAKLLTSALVTVRVKAKLFEFSEGAYL